jgi:hypothetical protein
VEAFDRWRGIPVAALRLDRLLRHVGPLVLAALQRSLPQPVLRIACE